MARRSTLAELIADPESSAPAIIAPSPAVVVSYKSLAEQVERLAGQLRGADSSPAMRRDSVAQRLGVSGHLSGADPRGAGGGAA